MSRHLSTTLALVLLCASWAMAQEAVTLQFLNGEVTVRARNAPVRAILAEWARLGGATIVNGDRVTGAPVTIELTGVPERQALDVILRNVAGYVLAPRRAGSTAASTFDRIVILPTSAAPRNPPPAAPVAGARPPALRPPIVARPPAPEPDASATDVTTNADGDGSADASTIPPSVAPPPPVAPGARGVPPLMRRPRPTPPPTPAANEPADDKEQEETAGSGADPATPTSATNPFGMPPGSSARPGVIAPAPRPQQPQQPQPAIRRVQ